MKHRMATAMLSLIGLFVALYLSLWKIGLMGPMLCGTGSCEAVQTSRYASLLGMPVAFYGVAGFLAILTVSIAGLQPKFAATRGPTKLLVVLGGVGAAFAGYLTYIEAFVLQAWCRWCVVSALLIVCVFAVALVGLKERPPDTSH
ncbi:MAG: vitamin K epoxide reductase family protein [Gemmatimonadetes bacterium]|nr:vitamin K epoxide reductase family protein [Gemmatimonadota bacterium]